MQNKFPLWKNISLILLVVLGILYAVPNLYGEDPMVQISSQTTLDNQEEQLTQLLEQVKAALKSAKLTYKVINIVGDTLELRFKTTDEQLLAQDLLKAKLNAQYTIALNLASTTPNFLRKIGAQPMKQGLDLRGGVHFLLEVDVDSVMIRRFDGIMKNIAHNLRGAKIRYTDIRLIAGESVTLYFKTAEIRTTAAAHIKDAFPDLILNESNDNSQAIYSLVATLSSAERNEIRQNTIEQTMSILRNRVNELGVAEAVVQQQGATRVGVELPGIQDAARAKQILGGTATLQFYLVDEENDAQKAKQAGVIPLGSKLFQMNGVSLLLKRQLVLSGDSITSAISSFDDQTASPAVHIQLGGGGENLFSKITRENIGKRMAIVFVETKTATMPLLINGAVVEKRVNHREERIISAPVIQSGLGNNFQITGLTDSKEANNLAILLRAGALPAAIYPIEERTVGPSLGKENIHRGMLSLEVGMGIILVVMLLYYQVFGIVADIALFLNIILLGALMSIIGVTLTLPGIAGFVLTVGMAVDANVLIYERIREELRAGLSPQAAIYRGYDRAFATIIDANVTTLIVGVVLFAIGAGAIRGFAVVLSLGLLTSMLTSITYTRALVNWYYGSRLVKKLAIGI